MKKKSICIFIRSLSKGGAEKQAILLSKFLSEKYHVYLVVLESSGDNSHQVPNELNVLKLQGGILGKALSLYKILKNQQTTHMFNYLPSNNLLGIAIGKIAGVKYIYGGIRGVKYKSIIKMVPLRFLCNFVATKFISNSQAAADAYAKYGFRKDKIIVIRNAIEKIESYTRSNNDFIRILTIGRFTSEKDIGTAISALDQLVTQFPEVKNKLRYKIVGYGEMLDEVINKIKQSAIAEITEIDTTGIIGNSYRDSDILLHTSIYEGMSNVIMEAMNNGLVIVATDAGDTSYLIENGNNGFLCPIRDYKFIAERLKEIIDNEESIPMIGGRSIQILDEGFRPVISFKQYLELIDEAHGKKI